MHFLLYTNEKPLTVPAIVVHVLVRVYVFLLYDTKHYVELPPICFNYAFINKKIINILQEFINPFTYQENNPQLLIYLFSLSKTYISSYINIFDCLSITVRNLVFRDPQKGRPLPWQQGIYIFSTDIFYE